MAIVVVASAVTVLATRRHGTVALFAVGLALGAASAAWHVHGLRSGVVPVLASRHADADVIARLVRDPAVVTTATGSRLTLIDATVTSVLADGWRAAHSPILILSYGTGWDGLLPGQRVEVVGRFGPPRPGDDVAAVIDARAPPVTIGQPPWWQRAAGRVREALRRACNGLPADERGLVPGLVDGDVAAEPPTLQADMKLTGLTHLQAVSGENVAVVLAVVLAVARSVGLRRRARIAMAAVALMGFVVLARPSPSVLRAAVMGGIVLAAMATGRRVAAIPALSAAVLLLVCLDPFLARSVGFVLSVCATAGILLIAPRWTRWLDGYLPTPMAAMIAVPAAAQLSCTPVLVLAFGRLTPYAIPANLLAAPAVVPATVLGVLCAVLATISEPLAVAVAWLAAVPTAVIPMVARSLASLPGAGLRWPGGVTTAIALGAVAVVVAAACGRRAARGQSRAILGRWLP
jgi:competence protein ComEC